MLLLSLLYDIREALYFKNVGFSAFSGFSRVRKFRFISSSQIWLGLDLSAGYKNIIIIIIIVIIIEFFKVA